MRRLGGGTPMPADARGSGGTADGLARAPMRPRAAPPPLKAGISARRTAPPFCLLLLLPPAAADTHPGEA